MHYIVFNNVLENNSILLSFAMIFYYFSVIKSEKRVFSDFQIFHKILNFTSVMQLRLVLVPYIGLICICEYINSHADQCSYQKFPL